LLLHSTHIAASTLKPASTQPATYTRAGQLYTSISCTHPWFAAAAAAAAAAGPREAEPQSPTTTLRHVLLPYALIVTPHTRQTCPQPLPAHTTLHTHTACSYGQAGLAAASTRPTRHTINTRARRGACATLCCQHAPTHTRHTMHAGRQPTPGKPQPGLTRCPPCTMPPKAAQSQPPRPSPPQSTAGAACLHHAPRTGAHTHTTATAVTAR
jgi:hypothetical protein